MVYNFNLSAYHNLKGNLIATKMAQNRWGSKFKRLYTPYKDQYNKFDFTQGMYNCAGTDVQEKIEEIEFFISKLNVLSKLNDGTSATSHSYFSMLCKSDFFIDGKIDNFTISDVKFSLSLSRYISEDDNRAISLFFQKNAKENNSRAYLEPINSYFDRQESVEANEYQKAYYSMNKLFLEDKEGNKYGHVDSNALLKKGTTFSNILNIYGLEQSSNGLFLEKESYLAEFNMLFDNDEFNKYLKDFVQYSLSWEKNEPTVGNSICIVFGMELILSWFNEKLGSWISYLRELNRERTGIELELINHLNLCDTLKEEIGNHAGDIASIWFEFKKTVTPPRIPIDGGSFAYDLNYKWWEEEQFSEIRKRFKNFHLFFELVIEDAIYTNSSNYIIAKDSIWELSGWKIYWIVSALFSIDSRTRKRSFLVTTYLPQNRNKSFT